MAKEEHKDNKALQQLSELTQSDPALTESKNKYKINPSVDLKDILLYQSDKANQVYS